MALLNLVGPSWSAQAFCLLPVSLLTVKTLSIYNMSGGYVRQHALHVVLLHMLCKIKVKQPATCLWVRVRVRIFDCECPFTSTKEVVFLPISVSWLVGLLVGLLVGGLDGWMDGWVDGWMDGWMVGLLDEWWVGLVVGWLVGWSAGLHKNYWAETWHH